MELRFAQPSDGPGIQAIYGPIVAETAISFEVDVPDADEMARRVAAKWPRHPWLVADDGEAPQDGADGVQILGYAYAGPFSGRAAYDWSVEVSLYVHPAARRRGVGRALYTALFELLRLQGHAQAFAGIALPNPGSIAAHEAVGFVTAGCYRNVGWKHGRWHDISWWQRPLIQNGAAPSGPPRPLDQLTPAEISSALAQGHRHLVPQPDENLGSSRSPQPRPRVIGDHSA